MERNLIKIIENEELKLSARVVYKEYWANTIFDNKRAKKTCFISADVYSIWLKSNFIYDAKIA